MQREIEALLAAYLDERKKEAQLIEDLLTALSVGAAGRQRMFDAIAAIAGPPSDAVAAAPASISPLTIADDLTLGIGALRRARDAALTH